MNSRVCLGITLSAVLLAPILSGCIAALPVAAAAVGGAGVFEGFKKGGEQAKDAEEDTFSRATAAALNVSPYKVGVSNMHRGFKDTWTAQVAGQNYSCSAYSSTLHDPVCTALTQARN